MFKKLRLLLIPLSIFALASCEDSDEPGNENPGTEDKEIEVKGTLADSSTATENIVTVTFEKNDELKTTDTFELVFTQVADKTKVKVNVSYKETAQEVKVTTLVSEEIYTMTLEKSGNYKITVDAKQITAVTNDNTGNPDNGNGDSGTTPPVEDPIKFTAGATEITINSAKITVSTVDGADIASDARYMMAIKDVPNSEKYFYSDDGAGKVMTHTFNGLNSGTEYTLVLENGDGTNVLSQEVKFETISIVDTEVSDIKATFTEVAAEGINTKFKITTSIDRIQAGLAKFVIIAENQDSTTPLPAIEREVTIESYTNNYELSFNNVGYENGSNEPILLENTNYTFNLYVRANNVDILAPTSAPVTTTTGMNDLDMKIKLSYNTINTTHDSFSISGLMITDLTSDARVRLGFAEGRYQFNIVVTDSDGNATRFDITTLKNNTVEITKDNAFSEGEMKYIVIDGLNPSTTYVYTIEYVYLPALGIPEAKVNITYEKGVDDTTSSITITTAEAPAGDSTTADASAPADASADPVVTP